ncbi:MAG: pyridoxal phosphate-dependent aminotransferase [Acidimicrobiales bacterium]
MTAQQQSAAGTAQRIGTSGISLRARRVTPSATLVIDAKAKALRDAGIDVINFGAGEPDFPTPTEIVEAAVAACRDPRSHRYSPTPGLPELRAEIAARTSRETGVDVAADQVLVSNGAKHAIANAFTALLDPGDEVLVAAPYWTTYPESIALAEGVPVVVPTDESTGFRIGAGELERHASERTKALLFVSPSNPTGAVYSRDEMEQIGELARDRGWWVVADEIYEHLVYGDARHYSMPAIVPDIAERAIVVSGVSKTFAMTGWRVGWMIGPRDVITAAANIQSHETSNVDNVAQFAALAALRSDPSIAAEMRATFDRRRIRAHEMLNAIPAVTSVLTEGAFYAFPSLSGVLGRSFGGRRAHSAVELAEVALDEVQVAFVPGEAFGAPGYARFSYALANDELEEGLTRIRKLVESSTE